MKTEFAHHSVGRQVRRRLVIQVFGTVQGVGFRPFVYELAVKRDLTGSVRNHGSSVSIDVEGRSSDLDDFLYWLNHHPPRLAKIDKITIKELAPRNVEKFQILESVHLDCSEVFISPDIATCEDCVRELFDSNDRRKGYPFINCTNCGPRLTIIEDVPYDRSQTTMKRFPLCEWCEREYHDPKNRRFHAQPIACFSCGPKLSVFDRAGMQLKTTDPIKTIAQALLGGQVAAIKSLGGYHLACDARDADVVKRLRKLKHRDDKPFAIMLSHVGAVEEYCQVTLQEVRALNSIERPIVLLRKNSGIGIAPEVAQGSPRLGVMLPYTPLHHLLMKAVGDIPLVMTSGNESDQPIVFSDQEAISRLGRIADLFLCHDRAIEVRCDDSVVWVPKRDSLRTQIHRRSRGYAPNAIKLPLKTNIDLLSLGAQQKNTFSLLQGENAVLSHHMGDLDDFATYQAYRNEIVRYERLFKVRPRVLVRDFHPDYLSTRYATERAQKEGLQVITVQHHHAHMASCMAENGLTENVIAVTFDGTGYGEDGNIWGGEFLLGGYLGFRRMAHLKYVPIPSGEKAILEPWRMAYSHLVAAQIDPKILLSTGAPVSTPIAELFDKMIRQEINAPFTSSMGRLFDAVSSMIGIRHRVSYEGQAAIELEWAAQSQVRSRWVDQNYLFDIHRSSGSSPLWVIDPAPVIQSIVSDLKRGVDGPDIAFRFHSAVSRMVGDICARIRDEIGLNQVVLSGGVFMNALLSDGIMTDLEKREFKVFCHSLVPCNDGGICLGQAAVAAAQLNSFKRRLSDVLSDSR